MFKSSRSYPLIIIRFLYILAKAACFFLTAFRLAKSSLFTDTLSLQQRSQYLQLEQAIRVLDKQTPVEGELFSKFKETLKLVQYLLDFADETPNESMLLSGGEREKKRKEAEKQAAEIWKQIQVG